MPDGSARNEPMGVWGLLCGYHETRFTKNHLTRELFCAKVIAKCGVQPRGILEPFSAVGANAVPTQD